MRERKNKAQSFAEYAILISLIAAAFIAMQVFMLRSVQAKFRESADVFGQGEQYRKGSVITQTATTSKIAVAQAPLEGIDACALAIRQVAELEKEINGFDAPDPDDPTGKAMLRHPGLLEQEQELNKRATEMEADIRDLKARGQIYRAAGLEEVAADLRERAKAAGDKARDQQQKIKDIQGKDKDREVKCFG